MSADGPAPELAVVVIGVGAPPDLVPALRSLQAQDVALEIVVVNTGGGDAAGLLARHGLAVPVVERAERLLVGAARNLGIAATRAPHVAFLASDCVALPGWAAQRLAQHRQGIPAVASALVNSHPRSTVAWAAHLTLYWRRLPGIDPRHAVCFGASYGRWLFEVFGRFREDLLIGEDNEFHGRLPPAIRPVWCAAVQAAHRNPTRLGALLADQYRRGARIAQTYGGSAGLAYLPRLGAIPREARVIIRRSCAAVAPDERRLVRRAQPLVMLGLLFRRLGWWRLRRRLARQRPG